MTVIAGVETPKGTVVLGADSIAVSDECAWGFDQPKAFRVGPYVMGFAGSWRVGQLLRYAFTPPSLSELTDTEELTGFMVNRFVPRFHRVLLDAGFQADNEESMKGVSLLVGLRGHLFEVSEDFAVGRTAFGYGAIGAGSAYAMGSFATTIDSRLNSKNRLLAALEATEKHCHEVRSPFVTVEA